MTESIMPSNVESSAADIARADNILISDQNYIVRYLRDMPTVGIAYIPTRHADGSLLEDVPPKRKHVICAGIPYACMIAFMYQEKLLIGWSKRLQEQRLPENQPLVSLFNKVVSGDYNVETAMHGREGAFKVFVSHLTKFMCCQGLKDIEIPFSKIAGKRAAIIRGLNDSIIVKGRYLESRKSGPIPGELAKSLPQFIKFAEQTYGGKAVNVEIPGRELVEKPTDAIVAV